MKTKSTAEALENIFFDNESSPTAINVSDRFDVVFMKSDGRVNLKIKTSDGIHDDIPFALGSDPDDVLNELNINDWNNRRTFKRFLDGENYRMVFSAVIDGEMTIGMIHESSITFGIRVNGRSMTKFRSVSKLIDTNAITYILNSSTDSQDLFDVLLGV